MSYKSVCLRDNPSAFWLLDESSGSQATDISGCGNHGSYSGNLVNNLLPIVHESAQSFIVTSSKYVDLPVNKDYSGLEKGELFGISYHSEKSFSIEFTVKLKISTSNKTTLVADSTNNVGVFYEGGVLIFQCDSEEVYYTPTYLDKTLHVVAVYDNQSMSLYIDGEMVSQKLLSKFNFSNTSISLKSGPTSHSSDQFLINAVSIYRYALSSSKILNHYKSNKTIPAIQIVDSLNGELFEIFDDQISSKFTYSYPNNMPWTLITKDGLYYNESENSLSVLQSTGSKNIEIIDLVGIPSGFISDSSKIEWDGDNGVSVSTSLDGVTYTQCQNGSSIPQFKLGSFSTSKSLYLKINFITSNAEKYLPKIKNLTITFYNNQIKYANNSGSYIKTLEGEPGTNSLDISLGDKIYPILSRNAKNGIRCSSNSGFSITTANLVSTIEFFCKTAISTDGAFVAFPESGPYETTYFEWNSTGSISKSNISAIYVNGQDKSSQTNIANILVSNQLSHVVIVLTEPISGKIFFNYNFSETSGDPATYQNIALYPSPLSSGQALSNFNIYRYGSSTSISDYSQPSISISEESTKFYDNDWLVVQNS